MISSPRSSDPREGTPEADSSVGGLLRRRDLVNVFIRAFFFHSLWNVQRMQGVGWLFSFWPVIRRLAPDGASRAKLAGEHAQYFNTHPHMVTILLGVVAGMEERYAAGDPVKRDDILSAKKFMSGPLAALGETLFGATARPFLALAALCAGWTLFHDIWWAAPALFLTLNGAIILTVRWAGLWAGYHRKTDIADLLARLSLQRLARGAALLGIALCIGGVFLLGAAFGPEKTTAVFFAAAALLALFTGLSSTHLVYGLAGGGVLWAYLARSL